MPYDITVSDLKHEWQKESQHGVAPTGLDLWKVYRRSQFRNTLNAKVITVLDMCVVIVCAETVHSVAV